MNASVPATQTSSENVSQPAKSVSLRWNFSWTFVGNVIYSGCQWCMLVVLAKLGNPTIVGQYGLALREHPAGGNVFVPGPQYAHTATEKYLNTRKLSIYGGSNEIQRNIIAKAVLGL